jgi:hypothetical protein
VKILTIKNEVEFQLAGVCGLYCGNCSIFRAYNDNDLETLEKIANAFNITIEKIKCQGCRVDEAGNWNEDCGIRKCAKDKGLNFCFECEDYPCEIIQEFAESHRSHKVIIENAKRIKEAGWQTWIREQDEKWRCPQCKHKISFYTTKCKNCGTQIS